MTVQVDTETNSTDENDADDALPFRTNETDVHEGIGQIVTIESLADHTDGKHVTDDGRCQWCGYDRGKRRTHTEVDGYLLSCAHCLAKLRKVA